MSKDSLQTTNLVPSWENFQVKAKEPKTLPVTSCSWFEHHSMTQPEGQTFLWFSEEREKKILLWGSGPWLTPSRRRCKGLSWQQRDFLLLPIHQLEHSAYRHLKRTAPPQVIPKKSPPTLGNQYFNTWSHFPGLWCSSLKNTLLNKFSPPTAVCYTQAV